MALFKYFKHKALQKFSRENFIGSNLQKFSPANFSMFTIPPGIIYIHQSHK